MDSIIDTSFVRKDFYVNPPKTGASREEWEAWLEADAKAAASAKRAHTRASKDQPRELPESLAQGIVTKVNGVYRQSCLVGFTGDKEAGTLAMDVADPHANPHRDLSLGEMEGSRHHRGQRSKHRASRNRRQQRAARFAKRNQQ